MVRASVRFLLFTRRAAIIEIWSPPVEHDIEPKPLKSNNTSSLSLGSWSGHRVFILFSPLFLRYRGIRANNLNDLLCVT